jgi:hypothetical protein
MVILSLCLSTTHEYLWGSGGLAPPFLTSARGGGEWSASHPGHITPGERALGGRDVAQRLDAGFPPRRPGFPYGHHVGFVVDKAALGQVFSEYFGFPCQSFHRFLHHHNHPGLTQ